MAKSETSVATTGPRGERRQASFGSGSLFGFLFFVLTVWTDFLFLFYSFRVFFFYLLLLLPQNTQSPGDEKRNYVVISRGPPGGTVISIFGGYPSAQCAGKRAPDIRSCSVPFLGRNEKKKKHTEDETRSGSVKVAAADKLRLDSMSYYRARAIVNRQNGEYNRGGLYYYHNPSFFLFYFLFFLKPTGAYDVEC